MVLRGLPKVTELFSVAKGEGKEGNDLWSKFSSAVLGLLRVMEGEIQFMFCTFKLKALFGGKIKG